MLTSVHSHIYTVGVSSEHGFKENVKKNKIRTKSKNELEIRQVLCISIYFVNINIKNRHLI